MASLSPDSFMAAPLALLGLSLLIPVVILYLLKPKPKRIRFPSTMFIKVMEKNKRFTSFLQKFIRDPILFMQLSIITFLVLAIADPFTTSMEQQKQEQSIAIVVDASASMQATDVKPSRIDAAIVSARRILDDLGDRDDVSVVLAESIPVTLVARGTVVSAGGVLGKIKASDTATNLGDAIILAKDMLSGSRKKRTIYVISDFMNAQGLDPLIARKVASVEGISVSFVSECNEKAPNVGIVSLSAKRSLVNESRLVLTATLRNFGDRDSGVDTAFVSEGRVVKNQSITVKAGGEEFVYLDIGISEREQIGIFKASAKDSLAVDDVTYIHIPEVKTYNVLLLTSDDPDTDKYLKYMLSSLKNVQLKVEVPPVAPSLKNTAGLDVIVLGTVKSMDLLPGTFKDIKNRVESGGSLIIVGSSEVPAFREGEFWAMTPLYPGETMNEETNIQVTQEHEMMSNVVLDNVVLKRYLKVNRTLEGAKVLAGTLGANPTPLAAYRELGKGYVMFMNINPNPDYSNFYYSSSFPILWTQMIRYFNRPRDSEGAKNRLTGEYLQLPDEHVIQTPGEKVKASTVFLDRTGPYSVYYDSMVDTIAVNLLNSAESNLTCVELKDSVAGDEFEIRREDVEVKKEYYDKIIIAILLLILVEAVAYRRRGLL